jgi:hypothetical protein
MKHGKYIADTHICDVALIKLQHKSNFDMSLAKK